MTQPQGYATPEDGWIPLRRVPEWISSRLGRRTDRRFWNEVVALGRLETKRRDSMILVSERSLLAYTKGPR